MHAKTEKTFLCNDDLYKALNIYIVVGARDLHIDKAHTTQDIFRFEVFLFHFVGHLEYFYLIVKN